MERPARRTDAIFSDAFSVIGVAASARETMQPVFAFSACSWNVAIIDVGHVAHDA